METKLREQVLTGNETNHQPSTFDSTKTIIYMSKKEGKRTLKRHLKNYIPSTSETFHAREAKIIHE